jgi:hypothetical protein
VIRANGPLIPPNPAEILYGRHFMNGKNVYYAEVPPFRGFSIYPQEVYC